jgi:ABC-type phosphate transport system substrate-binding protein
VSFGHVYITHSQRKDKAIDYAELLLISQTNNKELKQQIEALKKALNEAEENIKKKEAEVVSLTYTYTYTYTHSLTFSLDTFHPHTSYSSFRFFTLVE